MEFDGNFEKISVFAGSSVAGSSSTTPVACAAGSYDALAKSFSLILGVHAFPSTCRASRGRKSGAEGPPGTIGDKWGETSGKGPQDGV